MGPWPHTAVSAAPGARGLPVPVLGNGVGGIRSPRCDRGAQSLPGVLNVWKETARVAPLEV